MELPELTDQQRALVETSGEMFAEACPGGGKTRAIVERFLRRTAEEPRKGIALVSFTSGAVEEVRRRCGRHITVTQAPHFIGTFDSFINRFIVRPFYAQAYKDMPNFRTPKFMDTWDGIDRARFRVRDMPNLPDYELGWFAFDSMLRATLMENSITARQIKPLMSFASERKGEVERVAAARCRELVSKGLIASTASRALADGYLRRSGTRDQIGSLLANRFSEVIVDEAQDCGPEELHVLELLRMCEVPVVAVADLDQSIYEFRRAEPAYVQAFAETFSDSRRLILDGNHRSSPAICSVNNSLRQGKRPETAVGKENKSCLIPVQLLGYDQQKHVTATVAELVAGHDLRPSEVIFLAHKAVDAQSFAGARRGYSYKGDGRVVGVARASAVLRSAGSSSNDRRKAVALIEGTLRLVVGLDEADPLIGDRWLRGMVERLALSVDPAVPDPQQYSQALRGYVNGISWPSGVNLAVTLGTFFQPPKSNTWKIGPTKEATTIFRSSTIHSVKGQEFPCVVVVLPEELYRDSSGQHVLDHWEQDTGSEPRRVLYVGASRARKLLILAVHNDHFERVSRILKDDGVAHDRHEQIMVRSVSAWSSPGLF